VEVVVEQLVEMQVIVLPDLEVLDIQFLHLLRH
jgi:hypothetical protein